MKINPYDLLLTERFVFYVLFAAGIALGGWIVANIENQKRMIKAFLSSETSEEPREKKEGRLAELITRAGMAGQEVNLLVMVLALSVTCWFFGYSLTGSQKLAWAFVSFGPLAAWQYLLQRAEKNEWAMFRQTGDMCKLMANAVRAGMTVERALPRVAEKLEPPLKGYMLEASRRVNKGDPVVDVLKDFQKYVRVTPYHLFVRATAVGKKRGGDLAEAYTDVFQMVIKSMNAMNKVRVVNNSAVRRGLIVTAVPVGMTMLLRAWAPDYIAPLFNTTLGYIALGIVGLLVAGAWIIIKKLSRLEVV